MNPRGMNDLADMAKPKKKQKLTMKWLPISKAPKTPEAVVLLRIHEDLDYEGKILVNYTRVSMGRNNVFYSPLDHGECVVRDATHFMLMRDFAPVKKEKP